MPALALALAAAAAVQAQPPDVITLRNGRRIEAVLLRAGERRLWLGQATRVRTVERADVLSMSGPRVAWPEYVPQLRRVFSGDSTAEERAALARWCRERGLLRSVDLHYWHTLLADPAHLEAHRALGHRQIAGRWAVRTRNHGWVRWPELLALREDFSNAWEFSTAHFAVKAAGSLGEALRTCSTLELSYDAFYTSFQETVGFYELREPIRVVAYRRFGDYPSISNYHRGYFDAVGRQIYTYFQDGEAVGLVHEASHALLHFTAREWGRQEPRLPGWLDEGLAVYMDTCMTGDPGAEVHRPGARNENLFAVLAAERRPLNLARVLNLDTSDFLSSSRLQLKYAEAYTLVFWLLRSRDIRIQEGFQRFLRSAYDRKGSMSHFRKTLGVRDLDALEARWLDYVRQPGELPRPGRR